MTRYCFHICLIAVVISSLTSSLFAANVERARPNIVFLFADDQSTYSVGCYGNKDVRTPNMDQLARDGVAFDNHYNTTAICMASRANVFTGMYEYKTGCNFGHGNMHADVWAKSYPVLLRDAGYVTAFAGKFGIVVQGKGLCEDDFDFWGGGPGQTNYATAKNKSMQKYAAKYPHSTLSYGAFGQDVIREAVNQKKPFCLSISFKAPHKPATPDPRFNDVYAGKTFTKPKNFGREFGEHLSPQSKAGRQYLRFTDWKYDTDYDGEMAKYHQQVYGIDVAVGMIRDELKAQGVADNTVVIYTSDNGYICGSHGYGSKVLPMEESSRVPLMIYDPRSPLNGKQIRCDRLTGNIDFAPTILELAGLPVPSNMDGNSLLGLLQDPEQGGHDQMSFINVYGALPTQSLTCVTRQYKYTYWWYGNDKMKPVEELFDTQNDPLELKNLAGNPGSASTLEAMRKRYDQELTNWKKRAVDYNDYQRYGTLFDRTISLDEKRAFMVKKRKVAPNRGKKSKEEPKRPRQSEKRKYSHMEWWRDARYGMFIHWGLHSIAGGEWNGKDSGKEQGGASAEWLMNSAKISGKEYRETLAPKFNPTEFDAKEWVAIAKSAGMKYIVITSKHHDGFCLFETKATDYNVMDTTPFKRDIIRELSDECAKQGLKFGVYYSQFKDWYHRNRGRNNPGTLSNEKYLELVEKNLDELLSNYGEMSVLWFDTGGNDVIEADRQGARVRELQPGAVICSRLYSRSVPLEKRTYADFESLPDRMLPAERMTKDTETCMTMRHNWGYDRNDNHWKSEKDIIEFLALCGARGVNLLLNVGPTPEGRLLPEEIERLKTVGKWMKVNGESIYGTKYSPVDFDFWWGAMTQKDKTVYLHILEWKAEGIEFNGIVGKPGRAYFLNDPERKALPVTYDANGHITKIEVPEKAPDLRNTVIAVEYDGPVIADPEAKGKYHWYTTRSKRHTEIRRSAHAGKTKLLKAVTE